MKHSIHATTLIDLIKKKGALAVDAKEYRTIKSVASLS